jgi:TPR repeat protein
MAFRKDLHRDLLVILVGFAFLSACTRASEPIKGDPQEELHSGEDMAHHKGLNNANAMMRNAAACEPPIGSGDVGACQRACELNHSNSCANWGSFVETSDAARARQLYERSCVGGSGIGCEARARMAADAGETGLKQQYLNARRYHRVHCAQGYARSCSQLAGLLEAGNGGEADAATGQMYRERACLLGKTTDCDFETIRPAKQ